MLRIFFAIGLYKYLVLFWLLFANVLVLLHCHVVKNCGLHDYMCGNLWWCTGALFSFWVQWVVSSSCRFCCVLDFLWQINMAVVMCRNSADVRGYPSTVGLHSSCPVPDSASWYYLMWWALWLHRPDTHDDRWQAAIFTSFRLLPRTILQLITTSVLAQSLFCKVGAILNFHKSEESLVWLGNCRIANHNHSFSNLSRFD